MKIKVGIKGMTPLLMHRFSEEQYNNPVKDKTLTPRESADIYAYKLSDDELYIPGEAIFSCLMNGAKIGGHKLGKNKITTNKSSLLPAGVTLLTNACKLGTKKFEVDTRSVVNNAIGGARLILHRPRLDEWQTEFELDVDQNMFPEKLVRMIVDDAGRKAGLLSFRPERKGYFGQFVVTKWKVTNTKK